MSYEIHANYEQTFLLPPCLDDWIDVNHPARLVRVFIDSLDLEKLGFKVRQSDDGRPNYSAELLAKIVIYGNFEKVRSTRGLEKMCYNHLGMIWLTGMEHPDHNSIWRFLYNNKSAMKNLFAESVRLAMEMKLLGLALQAIDGTKIAADVSKKKTLSRRKLQEILSQLDSVSDEIFEQFAQSERAESGREYLLPDELSDKDKLKEKVCDLISELDDAKTNYLNPTDEDARMMRGGDGRKQFSYNAQAVVDAQAEIIVAADVIQDGNDNHILTEMIEQVEQNLGEVATETVADTGYYSGEQLAKAQDAEYDVIVNIPEVKTGRRDNTQWEFHKSKFEFDPETDTYICPKGGKLAFERFGQNKNTKNKKVRTRIYRCQDYENCPFRQKCSKNPIGRTIAISEFEHAVTAQKIKQKSPENQVLLRKRKTIVEPVFGVIKRIMGFRRWSVRGLANVRAQWSIVCCAYNLRKIHANWAKSALI